MHNTSFFKKILLIATVALFYSCDKEFNSIGDDIIGDSNFELEAEDYNVTAYNQKVTPTASNNLPINALGIYDNPVFGLTTANFNTQVALASYGPTLGEGAVIDSVTLNVPYFHHLDPEQTSTTGSTAYILDSIYGPKSGLIKLSVYESGIYLNNYNANSYDISKFYNTDRNDDFQAKAQALGVRLNDRTTKIEKDGSVSNDASENDEFFFNSKEIKETTPKTETAAEVIKRIKPEMRLHLNKAFFKAKIFDAPASKLASDDVFKNYFRGLYFKVEKTTAINTEGKPISGTMAMMKFSEGKINIFYKAKTAITTDAETVMESKTLVINLTGNTVSLLKEESSSPTSDDYYTSAATNDVTPDEKLYLKGGQGSMAVIELFDKTDLGRYKDDGTWETTPNGVYDELDEIRNNVTSKKWLTNEANLIFTIDSQKMASLIGTDPTTAARQPGRIYLYDLTNNTILSDYSADRSTSLNGDAKKSRTVFNGLLNIDPTTKIGTYKIRITNHIRNLIKNTDVTNVKLGLVVTESIDITASSKLDKTVESTISEIPTASVMSPLGTVLYGGNIPEGAPNYAKRVKLKIYYTKPN
ncbi:DUF4270 domain-containing protein [Flavobacterium salmonis]|uniref:DUF4270 domain-containing protein n=1 Tax=Flavobacterium salmonis TaxID=2654844 RepID=A0A6V6YPA6_9FLAO|nr:DUF4270 domain-containing protein [Flavobacterium salmonis]CAD0001216.1 hypothetical protein FLAT13_00447 [Flavobacterium salmonis]